jgi:hypothetical protein
MTESTITTTDTEVMDLDATITRLDVAQSSWAGGAATIARSALEHIRTLRNDAEYRVARSMEEAAAQARVITSLREQLDRGNREVTQFKDSVRDAAIAVQSGHSRHIDKAALNAWLEELGLDPVVTTWECEGTWRGIDMPSATVEADTEDEAESKYRDALSEASINVMLNLNGDVSDTSDVSFASNSVDDSVDWDAEVSFDIDDVEVSVSEA